GIGVAQIGNRLVGIRSQDGYQIWASPLCGHEAREAEDRSSDQFGIIGNAGYCFLGSGELVCFDIATGRRIWSRRCEAGSSPVHALANRVVTYGDGLRVALSPGNGRTLWFKRN